MKGVQDPAQYHRWYEGGRGRWIGNIEFDLVHRLLRPARGDSLLDVGCGTGYFTHRFALAGYAITGIDPAVNWLSFAKGSAASNEQYVGGRAERLPFPDRSFEHTLTIAALCFMPDPTPGIGEIVRVTRRRFAIGLLNRHSLLYREKGVGGGKGAYRGARWHTAPEVRALFKGLAVTNIRLHSAVFGPGASPLARLAEGVLPHVLLWGGLIVASGDICP